MMRKASSPKKKNLSRSRGKVGWPLITLLVILALVQLSSRATIQEGVSQQSQSQTSWKAEILRPSTRMSDLCVSNQDPNMRLHPLYQQAEFLSQRSVKDNEMVQSQYQEAIQFLQRHDLTTIHIYGHRSTDRTHRWIHFAWVRTWLDIISSSVHNNNSKTVSPLQVCWTDFVETAPLPSDWKWEHSLVLSTYGSEDIPPIVPSSYFIVHCMDGKKYHDILGQDNNVLQWYRPVYEHAPIAQNWQSGAYLDWATDLTPGEIEFNRPAEGGPRQKQQHLPANGILFCGTIWSLNRPEWKTMTRVAKKQEIVLHHYGKGHVDPWYWQRKLHHNPYYVHHEGGYIGHAQQYQMYREAYMTPSIQGSNHLATGYVPCRIFKTISAGQLGISNNKASLELFDPETIVVEHGDDFETLNSLMIKARTVLEDLASDQLHDKIHRAMTTVQNQHTYLARFVTMFRIFEQGENTNT